MQELERNRRHIFPIEKLCALLVIDTSIAGFSPAAMEIEFITFFEWSQ